MSRILISDGNRPKLALEAIMAERTFERMKGLLGRASLDPTKGMLIRPCSSIHMWFMRFPIDAAFLDKDLQVLKIHRNLKPWQIALARRGTTSVLEEAAGELEDVKTEDTLELI